MPLILLFAFDTPPTLYAYAFGFLVDIYALLPGYMASFSGIRHERRHYAYYCFISY